MYVHKADNIHTADGFSSLIEGVDTLAGAWTSRPGDAADTAAGSTVGVVVTTDVIHITTRSQLTLSHYFTHTHTPSTFTHRVIRK